VPAQHLLHVLDLGVEHSSKGGRVLLLEHPDEELCTALPRHDRVREEVLDRLRGEAQHEAEQLRVPQRARLQCRGGGSAHLDGQALFGLEHGLHERGDELGGGLHLWELAENAHDVPHAAHVLGDVAPDELQDSLAHSSHSRNGVM